MPFTDNAKNGMLGQLRARITEISLHSANPGTTGASELAGSGYARAAVSVADFGAAAGGEFELTTNLNFLSSPAQAVTFFGVWDGATFLGGGAITGDNVFSASGTYTLKTGTTLHLNA